MSKVACDPNRDPRRDPQPGDIVRVAGDKLVEVRAVTEHTVIFRMLGSETEFEAPRYATQKQEAK